MNFVIDPSRKDTFNESSKHYGIFAIAASVAKIDALWALDRFCYIHPTGIGGKGSKYVRALNWIQAKDEVWMPLLRVMPYSPDGFAFNDGRHTFSALRDSGFRVITVGVPDCSVAEATELFGV